MAYNFTAASSQYLSTTSAPVTAAPLTLACWSRVASTSSVLPLLTLQDANAQSRIVLAVNGSTAPKRAAQISAVDSSGNIGSHIGINETSYLANTWYHTCGVLQSLSNVSAYFNGAVGTSISSATNAPTGIDQVLIGARFATSLGQFHDGAIAEVGVWNAALTAAEIASLAKGMTCDKVRPQSLVFYAPLIRDLIDQKGGLAITNNNGATVATHPRVYA